MVFYCHKARYPVVRIAAGDCFCPCQLYAGAENAKAYIKIALTAAGIIIVLAYLVGSFFVSRSMKYIEQGYQKQKQFVSDAAHELRTPLTILYSYAELLEYNPKQTDVIAELKDEIQHINEW